MQGGCDVYVLVDNEKKADEQVNTVRLILISNFRKRNCRYRSPQHLMPKKFALTWRLCQPGLPFGGLEVLEVSARYLLAMRLTFRQGRSLVVKCKQPATHRLPGFPDILIAALAWRSSLKTGLFRVMSFPCLFVTRKIGSGQSNRR